MGLLTLIQHQWPDGFDQCFGLGQQAGVIGNGEHPGFSQVCHREIGRSLTRLLEQADGVAADEVERSDCPIVCVDGFGGRAGNVMSLGILDHGWVHCFGVHSAARCSVSTCWPRAAPSSAMATPIESGPKGPAPEMCRRR